MHELSVSCAKHRSVVYSSNVSTNRLDTTQMAMIRYTLTSTSAASRTSTPAKARDGTFLAWLLSASDATTVTVAVSASSQWSFTSTSRRWRVAFASSRVLVVLISPVQSPTWNGCCQLTDAAVATTRRHSWSPPCAPSPPSGLHPLNTAPAHSQRRQPTQGASSADKVVVPALIPGSVTLLLRGGMPASRALT
uniref:cDNA FLJ34090 fis, clone FCBBF3006399 n=1 Tax=Homo sapiens TaxID=9606 RepID=Q8NB83_HUMAN|nr:unnamed protein product [Homo sapiens]|eukprot:XP_024302051.1 uncharacterized protein LOC112267934 [Homo sapiens]